VYRIPTTVRWVSETAQHVSSRGWKRSAALVGLLAMFVAGWSVNALDLNNGWLYFVAWLAIAVGFIGIATVLLVPRRRHRCT